MTDRTAERAIRHHGDGASPPLQQGPDPSPQVRQASLVAGVALLLMSALAGFGYPFALHRLIAPGDAAVTGQNILAHQGQFWSGIACLFLVVALDVVVAWGLYRVFSPVSKGISALAAGLRLLYAGIFAVAVFQLLGAGRLLGDSSTLSASGVDRAQAQALSDINRFTDVWHAGLILFGLHLLVVAWLAYRSGYVPKALGVLIGIAGLGYIFDSIARFLSDASWPEVSTVTFIGEFLLALWLVIRGRRVTVSWPALQA
jgi:hypothetical protein